ncbi:MAG: DNA polymerase beta superfamily protein [bacterium]
MNLKQLKESDRIIYEVVAGSHAYGLNTPKSDIDIRGFYSVPSQDYLGLKEPPKQISDDKNDTTYYSVKRAFELLMTSNPNIIELLWMPKDCIKIQTPVMTQILSNRHLFISKKCYHTHSGYAYAQIKKAKGQNKKVHNPQPKEMPKKEDFCWVILDWSEYLIETVNDDDFYYILNSFLNQNEEEGFPYRPVPLSNVKINLKDFHVAALEHCSNIYRLYFYGDKSKGVFRGNDMLVCESIPKEDEHSRFAGLLIYNQTAYEKALKEWHSYWDWMKNRNDARWIDQEKGKLNFDQKNMCHCMRLLMSGENILRYGFPIVRFEGKQLDYLMAIRKGEIKYEKIMKKVEKAMTKLEDLYKTSKVIPHSVNMNKIDKLYKETQQKQV